MFFLVVCYSPNICIIEHETKSLRKMKLYLQEILPRGKTPEDFYDPAYASWDDIVDDGTYFRLEIPTKYFKKIRTSIDIDDFANVYVVNNINKDYKHIFEIVDEN